MTTLRLALIAGALTLSVPAAWAADDRLRPDDVIAVMRRIANGEEVDAGVVYVTEQTTPLYEVLSRRYVGAVGSEFICDGIGISTMSSHAASATGVNPGPSAPNTSTPPARGRGRSRRSTRSGGTCASATSGGNAKPNSSSSGISRPPLAQRRR